MFDQILRLLELLVELDREFIELIIVSIIGPSIGGLLGYYFSRYKTAADTLKTNSEAAKIKAETDALELKINSDSIKHYIEIIQSLQLEVKSHTDRLADMDKKLTASFDEKKRLKSENDELRAKVDEQGERIISQERKIVYLEAEVKLLQDAKTDKGDCDDQQSTQINLG